MSIMDIQKIKNTRKELLFSRVCVNTFPISLYFFSCMSHNFDFNLKVKRCRMTFLYTEKKSNWLSANFFLRVKGTLLQDEGHGVCVSSS
jgi:hypothetical protein